MESETDREFAELSIAEHNEVHVKVNNRENPNLGLVDVLMYDNDIIKDLTVAELLQSFKEEAFVS